MELLNLSFLFFASVSSLLAGVILLKKGFGLLAKGIILLGTSSAVLVSILIFVHILF